MRARIYRPAKNAMQSGKARTKQWLLEYEPETARTIDPLMGWTSSRDMRQQLCLEFDTAEEAVAYAKATTFLISCSSRMCPRPSPRPIRTISASTARCPGPIDGQAEVRFSRISG
jgi:hypothetical protein